MPNISLRKIPKLGTKELSFFPLFILFNTCSRQTTNVLMKAEWTAISTYTEVYLLESHKEEIETTTWEYDSIKGLW